MKKTLVTLITFTFLLVLQLHGQIFSKTENFKGTVKVKGKYFNGSGGKGYWDVKVIDSLGRSINDKSYKKKRIAK